MQIENKRRATYQALLAIESQKPGFIHRVKSKLRQKYGPGGLSGLMGMGDWADDLFSAMEAEQEGTAMPAETPEDESWWSGVVDTVVDTAKEVVPAWLEYERQKEWSEIQLERAKQGLPPIETREYGAPPITVKIAPERGAAATAMGIDPTTLQQLLIGGAIIAGIFFFAR